ncbi:MAG: hypothetical protein P8N76_11835 [Pirellulaceae bacterium]|nr:hypothetical protein [Pirellulaceae bacterium]
MTGQSDYNQTYVRRSVAAQPDFYLFWADGYGHQASTSRLYFSSKKGDVLQLPVSITAEFKTPTAVPRAGIPDN